MRFIRQLAVACTAVALVGLAACGEEADEGSAAADGGGGESTYGVIVLTRAADVYVAYEKAFRELVEQKGGEIIVLDSDLTVEKQQANVETALSRGANAISLSPVNDSSAVPLIRQAQEAGASVITMGVETDLVPWSADDSLEGGRAGGKAAAEYFQKQNPGEPIKIAMITRPANQNTAQRAKGFIEGVKSVDPNAEVVAEQDGGGELDRATTVAENVLQANPEANVWFGVNDNSALGALNALRSADRGTVESGDLVVGYDGSAEALKQVLDKESALKVEVGNQPVEFANKIFDALNKLRAGEEVPHKVDVPVKVITGDMTEDEVRSFYEDQYGKPLE